MTTPPTDRYRDGRYAHANPDWHEGDAVAKADGLAGLLESSGLRPATVVEVGCGTGAVLQILRARLGGPVCTGYDIAPAAIERASARAGEGLDFVCGPLPADARAQLLLCVDVFEHLEDDVGFLRTLAGRADHYLFRIPLDDSVLDRLRGRTAAFRERYGHVHAYSRRAALRRLSRAGFVVQAERYHRIEAGGAVARWVRRLAGRIAPHAAARLLGGWSLLVLARTD